MGLARAGAARKARAQLLQAVQRNLDAARFPVAAKDTRITLPFVFE